MNRRFVSILVVFLLITSVSIPAADAQFVQGAIAAPVVAKLVIDGITVIVISAVVIEIGKNIGKTWDETAENWDNFVKGVSTWIENALHAKKWIRVTDPEGTAVMRVVYELYAAGGSSGGKDDKWFFEVRKHDGRLEINTEAMTEEQALKEMGRGKNIMTVDRGLAENLIRKINNDPPNTKVRIEQHPRGKFGKEEYFDHGNFVAKNQRCHVWIWKP